MSLIPINRKSSLGPTNFSTDYREIHKKASLLSKHQSFSKRLLYFNKSVRNARKRSSELSNMFKKAKKLILNHPLQSPTPSKNKRKINLRQNYHPNNLNRVFMREPSQNLKNQLISFYSKSMKTEETAKKCQKYLLKVIVNFTEFENELGKMEKRIKYGIEEIKRGNKFMSEIVEILNFDKLRIEVRKTGKEDLLKFIESIRFCKRNKFSENQNSGESKIIQFNINECYRGERLGKNTLIILILFMYNLLH